MKKLVKNNKGVTLVEVLVVIVLITIVFMLVNSMHLFGLKQYNTQSQDIKNQSQIRLAMNMLTKEIRSADRVEVEDNKLKIFNNGDSYEYKSAGSDLKKDEDVVAKDVKMIISRSGNQVFIEIISARNNSLILKTNVYIRE